MRRLYLFGSLLLFVVLIGCSTKPHNVDSNAENGQNRETLIEKNSSKTTEPKENIKDLGKDMSEKKQETSNVNKPRSTSPSEDVSLEEMKHLKKALKTFIFDEYMSGPNYVYAKGINWTENFYDNLTAQEIWNVVEEFKKKNNGKEGTMFDKARYLSSHAPIKGNWKKLFMENWKSNGLSKGRKIDKFVDHGETVGVYTKSHPYTGKENNYPLITLDKRTGYWHG